MFCHCPIRGEDFLDNRSQPIRVEVLDGSIAPGKGIAGVDLQVEKTFNQPRILLLRSLIEIQPLHRCFKPARGMAKGLWQCPTGQIDDNCLVALTLRGLLVSRLELTFAGLTGKADFGHALCPVAINQLPFFEARRDPRIAGVLERPSHQTLLSGFCRRRSTRGESSSIACSARVLLSMATRRSTG